MPKLAFFPGVNQDHVSAYSRDVINDICVKAGVSFLLCSATIRRPEDEARAIFDNCRRPGGVEKQLDLYRTKDGQPLPGSEVVATYSSSRKAGLDDDATLRAMTARIVELGPSHVSHHCGDPALLNVLDFPISRISLPKVFAWTAEADRRVSKFIEEPFNDCFHMEIPQPPASPAEPEQLGFTSLTGSEQPTREIA